MWVVLRCIMKVLQSVLCSDHLPQKVELTNVNAVPPSTVDDSFALDVLLSTKSSLFYSTFGPYNSGGPSCWCLVCVAHVVSVAKISVTLNFWHGSQKVTSNNVVFFFSRLISLKVWNVTAAVECCCKQNVSFSGASWPENITQRNEVLSWTFSHRRRLHIFWIPAVLMFFFGGD